MILFASRIAGIDNLPKETMTNSVAGIFFAGVLCIIGFVSAYRGPGILGVIIFITGAILIGQDFLGIRSELTTARILFFWPVVSAVPGMIVAALLHWYSSRKDKEETNLEQRWEYYHSMEELQAAVLALAQQPRFNAALGMYRQPELLKIWIKARPDDALIIIQQMILESEDPCRAMTIIGWVCRWLEEIESQDLSSAIRDAATNALLGRAEDKETATAGINTLTEALRTSDPETPPVEVLPDEEPEAEPEDETEPPTEADDPAGAAPEDATPEPTPESKPVDAPPDEEDKKDTTT